YIQARTMLADAMNSVLALHARCVTEVVRQIHRRACRREVQAEAAGVRLGEEDALIAVILLKSLNCEVALFLRLPAVYLIYIAERQELRESFPLSPPSAPNYQRLLIRQLAGENLFNEPREFFGTYVARNV